MKRYALLAGFVGAVTCGAEAVTYAKYSSEKEEFTFYDDEACTTEVSGTLDGDTSVMFASDAEFQALVAHKDEIADARAKVVLQNDVKLTADADWRAFDFNINGKTITLDGWDCKVGRVQGTGTFAAGNLVTNGDFEADGENLWWKPPTGWSIEENSRCAVLGTGTNPQVLNKTGISYWAVLYTKNDAYPETAAFRQNVAISRSNWEYFVSFRYMTSGYNGSDGLVVYTPKNSRITVSIGGDAWKATQSCTEEIQTFATTIKDDKALPAGTHTLEFTLYKPTAGACFDDVVVSPLSRLFFDIPKGDDYDVRNLTLKDAGLQVRKVGKGTIVFYKANNTWRVEGSQSLIVSDGIARQAAASACGAQYAKISVSSGAQFDLYGRTSWDYDYILSGSGPDGSGALTSTQPESSSLRAYANKKSGFMRNATLQSDATLFVNKGCDWATMFYNYKDSTMTMGGHKLTIDGTPYTSGDVGGRLYPGKMAFSGEGAIEVSSNACVNFIYNDINAEECNVDIYGMIWSQHGKFFAEVESLKFHEGAGFRDTRNTEEALTTTVVRDTYAPNSSYGPRHLPNKWSGNIHTHPRVQLGAEGHTTPTLDLSEWDGTFDDSVQGTLTFYDVRGESEGSTGKMKVVVDIGGRTKRIAGSRSAIYKWKDDPRAYVEFVAAPSWASKNVKMSVKSDGIYGFSGAAIILR